MRNKRLLTQRISSGLYSRRHFKVPFSILTALFTFQFLAVKYLLMHASEQYKDSLSGNGPSNALTSSIWNKKKWVTRKCTNLEGKLCSVKHFLKRILSISLPIQNNRGVWIMITLVPGSARTDCFPEPNEPELFKLIIL